MRPSRTRSTDIGRLIWPFLPTLKHHWLFTFNMFSSCVKWPSRFLKDFQSALYNMTSAYPGLFHHTKSYHSMFLCLKFRYRQFTGMSVTMSQDGQRLWKFSSDYLLPVCIYITPRSKCTFRVLQFYFPSVNKLYWGTETFSAWPTSHNHHLVIREELDILFGKKTLQHPLISLG